MGANVSNNNSTTTNVNIVKLSNFISHTDLISEDGESFRLFYGAKSASILKLIGHVRTINLEKIKTNIDTIYTSCLLDRSIPFSLFMDNSKIELSIETDNRKILNYQQIPITIIYTWNAICKCNEILAVGIKDEILIADKQLGIIFNDFDAKYGNISYYILEPEIQSINCAHGM